MFLSKKWSPKLIFLDLKKKNEKKNPFDIENWLWKYDFGTLWGPGIGSIFEKLHNPTDVNKNTKKFRLETENFVNTY